MVKKRHLEAAIGIYRSIYLYPSIDHSRLVYNNAHEWGKYVMIVAKLHSDRKGNKIINGA